MPALIIETGTLLSRVGFKLVFQALATPDPLQIAGLIDRITEKIIEKR